MNPYRKSMWETDAIGSLPSVCRYWSRTRLEIELRRWNPCMHLTGSKGLEPPADPGSIAMFDIPSRLTIEPKIHRWRYGPAIHVVAPSTSSNGTMILRGLQLGL